MAVWVRLFTGVLAALSWSAIALQSYLAVTSPAGQAQPSSLTVVNVLSYFTIQTNILVAAVLTAASVFAPAASEFPSTSVQTAVAVYISIVGVVYHILLRQVWNPTGLQLICDRILHYVTPVGYLLYWLAAVPKGTLRYGHVWSWTIYPLAYLIYCVGRGYRDRFVPYPFVDFRQLGYPRFALNVVGLIAGFVGVGFAFIAFDRYLGRT